MNGDVMTNLSAKYAVSREALFIRFIMGLGIVPITSPLMPAHVADDLSAFRVRLSMEDAKIIDDLTFRAFGPELPETDEEKDTRLKLETGLHKRLGYYSRFLDDAKAGAFEAQLPEATI